MDKKREYIFDIIRVVSMFLVIVIHLSNYYMRSYVDITSSSYMFATIFNTFARVSVPLFLMISGALSLGKTINMEKYKLRILNFIKILFFWSIIYILFNKYYLNWDINIFKEFFQILFYPTKAHLWFMYAIIGINITVPFLKSMLKNMNKDLEILFVKLFVFLSGFVYILRLVMTFFNLNNSITYPVPIFQATYYLGYFISGYIIYKNIDLLKKYKEKFKLIFILSNIITITITFISSLLLSKYYQDLFAYRSLFMITSSISIFVLILLNKEKILKKTNLEKLNKISKHSFGIYLIHVIFLNIITENFNILKINSMLGIVSFSILIFFLSYYSIKILSKSKILKKFI